MSELTVAIIGAGTIAGFHLEAYAADPRVRIAWIYDANRSRAEDVAQRYGARGTDILDDVLRDTEVDAVSVCTWNDTHASFAIAALDAGKHVLVEKPMSRTVEEAERMVNAASASGRHLEVGMVRRHAPNAATLRRFIDAGDLGEMYYAKASFLRQAGNPGGWFTDRRRSGGGPLVDIGVHVLDLAWYLMGCPLPISVSANVYTRLGDRAHIEGIDRYRVASTDTATSDVEDLASALFRFDNGSSLFLDASYSLHIPQEELHVSVYGDHGGAVLEPSLQITTERHDRIVTVTPQLTAPSFDFELGFRAEIAHFVSLCRGEASPIATAAQGLALMRMLEGVYASAAAGSEISL